MSLRCIRLRNFRGFREATLELAPLTVLLGPNSAGKSSFGHALAAMSHAHKEFSTGQVSLTPTKPEEWPVDLGKTANLRTRGTTGAVRVELVLDGGVLEFGFGGVSYTPDLALTSLVHPSDDQSALVNVPPGQGSQSSPGGATTTIPISSVESRKIPAIRLEKKNEVQWYEGDFEAAVNLQGLVLKSVIHRSGTPSIVSVPVANELEALFRDLTYLRPSRAAPSRRYSARTGAVQPLGYSGEFSSGVYHNRREEQISYVHLPKVPENAVQAKNFSPKCQIVEQSLGRAVDAWLTDVGLAHKLKAGPIEGAGGDLGVQVSLVDGAPHDITEVGFGVSQFVPALLAGLLQRPNSLLVVDLPEAHLHPRPQALSADFFCSLALSGKCALVETHSEMFFHRLRLRVAMHPELNDRVAVYFIDAPKNGACASPRRVGLRYDDELQWPEGFLQEGWETETKISLIRGFLNG